MRHYSKLYVLFYIFFQSLLFADTDIQFVLPREFLEASNITLIVEKEKIQKTIDLKSNNKWEIDKVDLTKISNDIIWIIFDWDEKLRPQRLQVKGGKVFLLFDKLDLEYDFKIPLERFLAQCKMTTTKK